jgi:hypothetical protein
MGLLNIAYSAFYIVAKAVELPIYSNLFNIRLIKLKIVDAGRFGAPDLSLQGGRDKYAYLRVMGN